ncbi:MAG: efflux RND transporter periplasmic adaptor subunit [Asticcacaulis sp.]|uniref:efflux RND transporter periplasmic adaptor subunit n=1 Tax=Asticcacaulis sp. TaxID=1872648 RepID=UPI0039E68CD8
MSDHNHPLPAVSTRALTRAALAGGAIALVILVGGTVARLAQSANLKAETAAHATPSVMVFQPQAANNGKLVLPGRVQAWSEAPVYARTSGYLKSWSADIGQTVKAGQVLAEIDAPDVDQQLAASKAQLATARANYELAKSTADRWDRLLAQSAVSQQDADQKRGDLAARLAQRDAAAADVARLQTLAGFKRLVAPFDGRVTSRNTDVGALISAGGSAPAPLFTVSDTSKLRIYVSVPQSQLAGITDGMTAHFTMPDHPDTVFDAQVTRTAGAVDPQSGAMLIQLVVDNADNALKPGGYAQVTLDLPATTQTAAIRIPASALLFRAEGTAVAVVGPNNKVIVKPVKIGRDDGKTLDIASGLSAGDWVIDSPSDAVTTGAAVKPVHKSEANAKS